jgi:hypothetical protein
MRRYGFPKMALSIATFALAIASASAVHAQSWSTANSSLSAFPSSVKVGCGNAVPVGQLDVVSNTRGRIALIVNQALSSGNIVEFRQGTSPPPEPQRWSSSTAAT